MTTLQDEVENTLKSLNSSSNGNGPQIYALEIEPESEQESLIAETQNDNAFLSRNIHFRHRLNVSKSPKNRQYHTQTVFGTLRSQLSNNATFRNFAGLFCIGFFCLLLVKVLDWDLERTSLDHATAKNIHGPSLGGSNNPGHYEIDNDDDDNNDYFDTMDEELFYAYQLDEHNLPVPSITNINVKNAPGHYLHDPFKSPFASVYYEFNHNHTTVPQQIQQNFETKRTAYETKFGKWETVPSNNVVWAHLKNQTLNNKKYIPYKDWNIVDDFPNDAWQKDPAYVDNFLQQAKSLVGRIKEAIYEEYGYGILDDTSTKNKEMKISKRLDEFRVIIQNRLHVNDKGTAVNPNEERIPGIAFLNKKGWDALVRKLLHAIVTSDEFYVVLMGNADSYFGNNLFQTQIMQFNYIMEPVFDKLGVRLISRHMGMDASTAITALGGASLRGEADIVWYVPNKDEETPQEADLLHKQSILSGERVPIVLTPHPVPLWTDTRYAAWMGNLQPGATFCRATTVQDNKVIVPNITSCKYVNCRAGHEHCAPKNSVCWEPRTDVTLEEEQAQDADVGNQGADYPGYMTHRLEGRKLAMLVLHALDEALDQWSSQKEYPLPNSMWHVGDAYQEVREAVRSFEPSDCGRLLHRVDARICAMEMHAATEWTPRVNADDKNKNSLRSLLVDSVPDNHKFMMETYESVDILPLLWQPSEREMDVHLVSILSDADHLKGHKEEAKIDNKPKDNDNDDNIDTTGIDDDDGFYQGDDYRVRRLKTSDIAPKNWTIYNRPLGYCDGSAQARCNRIISNTCLLSQYNHYRSGILGHGSSGKLQFLIPNVREGLIVVRFDWEMEGGPRLEHLPSDFVCLITVDGHTTTRDKSRFVKSAVEIADGFKLHRILNDYNFEGPKDVKLEIEVSSEVFDGPLVFLSHIYWA